MLETVIQDLIKQQRPYYHPEGDYIKGVNNNYWLVFKHRDAENLLRNIVSFLGLQKHSTHKLFRIELNTAHIFEYTPKREGNIPSIALLRTSKLTIIEQFLNLENASKEESLIRGTFIEIEHKKRRRFNLPEQLDKYNQFIAAYLERTKIYRRSTAYFNSGVLKLYEEPLFNLVLNEGQIKLLMDWQGFTNKRDVQELEKLHNPEYRQQYITRTLTECLQGLADKTFSSTTILAELVRLGILTIKLVKMQETRGIYHKKTGILTDSLGNSILHEGSDNFTGAAHSSNAESITFLYYSDSLDLETIQQSIIEFDQEWQEPELSFDLTQEFLQQVLAEKQRRQQQIQPQIETISPQEFPAGATTNIKIKGKNLDKIEEIEIPDNPLIAVEIEEKQPHLLTGTVTVDPEHPSTSLKTFRVKEKQGTYQITPTQAPTIKQEITLPEWEEIAGFKQAIELILQGKQGTPDDFLYWLAQQRPHLLNIQSSNILDRLVNQDILFEHQKSGAQHCLRVMQNFGVVVCADAVGLGKTRLAAAVTKLYLEENPQTKIAIIAAKKLHPNWEREMAELGLLAKKHYELYNKNLMSRGGDRFYDEFTRHGGAADLVIIDEAHEGIRNYNNRIHKTCLQIKEHDRQIERQRYYLLLTATPWNNRREDIYNILSPFLTRPEGFQELGFPPEVKQWFASREIGIENFTDTTNIFRRTYRELFLQRTRKMLREATPDLQLYAQRLAQWLPVQFEPETEQALERIFSQFEDNLFIPFADPIRYLTSTVEQRSLLKNQRRMFLQRAESSMYALRRTIKNFSDRIPLLQQQLEQVTPDAEGLKQFLLQHYKFQAEKTGRETDWLGIEENGDEDYWEEEEDEEETDSNKGEKRQQLRRSIDLATDKLKNNPLEAKNIYNRILADCHSDLEQLQQISVLLANEFVTDHKRQQVSRKVMELVADGHKVLLISTFSDTVIDYYRYMSQNQVIVSKGIGMAMGSHKLYYTDEKSIKIAPNNALRGNNQQTGLQRQQLFRLFAPEATCKNPNERPLLEQEIAVLIGSETLSVGQNLQDADYLINIDLPWNPMVLEQRIGRIDRPKSHPCQYIYIYYANSESQLLRQAGRLANLNKKLIGELAKDDKIPHISNVEELGASVYGDTYFDDQILPGYIDFIHSLIKARQLEQESFQEQTYQKQETSRNLYSQNELLHSEELRKLYERLGEKYQPNPLTIGQFTTSELPTSVVALTLDYFDPNGQPIPEQNQLIYWNDLSRENDGLGVAIATAFKTPQASQIVPAKPIINLAQQLYEQLVQVKQKLSQDLEETAILENIQLNSERLSRIQKRIQTMSAFPANVNRKMVKNTLNKLSQAKETKKVQKLLKDYTDGEPSQLDDQKFILGLIQGTEQLNLLTFDTAKPSSLKLSLSAMLLRIWLF